MNVISKLLGVSLFVVGCATSGGGRPFAAEASHTRSIRIEGPSARSVVAGPSTIHAYSGYKGTSLFTVAAVTGRDPDCQRGLSAAAAGGTRLQADRVVIFNVPAGRVACVEGTSVGTHELIWHQTELPSGQGSLLATSSN
jgi:hypothetical protein